MVMSKYVTCDKCKQQYRIAEDIAESALIAEHECPGSVEERIAVLENRLALLEGRTTRTWGEP